MWVVPPHLVLRFASRTAKVPTAKPSLEGSELPTQCFMRWLKDRIRINSGRPAVQTRHAETQATLHKTPPPFPNSQPPRTTEERWLTVVSVGLGMKQ